MAEKYKCPECSYEAKTKGAITNHVRKQHANDPLAEIRNKYSVSSSSVYEQRSVAVAPSGIPAFDYAMGIGGVPMGAIVEIFGTAGSGKTAMSLAFSANAQKNGGRAGYMDTEEALTPTFVDLFGNLNGNELEYHVPPGDKSGESALQMSRDFITSGQFDVWTVDSVHGLTPRSMLAREIGDPNTSASLAQLCNEACKILKHEATTYDTLLVFVNHMKENPRATYGRPWSKPGGTAFNYYASVQVMVQRGQPYRRSGDKRQIGHAVKLKIHKSKVSMPFGTAEFDLFYGTGETIAENNVPSRVVRETGVDVASSYMSVLKESGFIANRGGRYVNIESGELYGSHDDVIEALRDEGSELFRTAHDEVYANALDTVVIEEDSEEVEED